MYIYKRGEVSIANPPYVRLGLCSRGCLKKSPSDKFLLVLRSGLGLARVVSKITHIGRSEISGYKLPGWDATWGTCLEQSLFKINP